MCRRLCWEPWTYLLYWGNWLRQVKSLGQSHKAGSSWFWRGTVLLPFLGSVSGKPTSSQTAGTLAVRVWRVQQLCVQEPSFSWRWSHLCNPAILPKSVCAHVRTHTHTHTHTQASPVPALVEGLAPFLILLSLSQAPFLLKFMWRRVSVRNF